ncbi:MAG: hypothetical protein HYY93_00230 [Planctomycetes bacterium]|nr:hypothetical protein [Planctomycetota bacterium]
MPATLTARSLARKVLFYSTDEALLDDFGRLSLVRGWDVILAVSNVAAVDELRARHIDLLITDEPSWILILHDRFPTPDARDFIVRHFFKHEYAYTEFLREYGERYRELSGGRYESMPTLLVIRRRDSTKNRLYEVARCESTLSVVYRTRDSVLDVVNAAGRILNA